jgi:hypothetical protein
MPEGYGTSHPGGNGCGVAPVYVLPYHSKFKRDLVDEERLKSYDRRLS